MASSNFLTFRLSHRYGEGEMPQALYRAMYCKLSELAQPWGLQGLPQIPMKEHRGAFTFGVNYKKLDKASPIKHYLLGIANRARSAPPADLAMNDDTLTVEFYPKKVRERWSYLMDVVFPAYVVVTGAYAGTLFDGDIAVEDAFLYDSDTETYAPNPGYIDPRHGVYRIWQANYWDRQLCRRSFNLEPEAIVKRLDGKVARCEQFADGVIVICSYDPLIGEDILKLNDLLLPLLRE
ncbi:MAG: hypothetical protein V4857_12830 [Pseudomonadota bacterium]